MTKRNKHSGSAKTARGDGASADAAARLPIEKPPQVRQRGPKKDERKGHEEVTGDEWNVVDEASWESFPASDPPAYTSGTDDPKHSNR